MFSEHYLPSNRLSKKKKKKKKKLKRKWNFKRNVAHQFRYSVCKKRKDDTACAMQLYSIWTLTTKFLDRFLFFHYYFRSFTKNVSIYQWNRNVFGQTWIITFLHFYHIVCFDPIEILQLYGQCYCKTDTNFIVCFFLFILFLLSKHE